MEKDIIKMILMALNHFSRPSLLRAEKTSAIVTLALLI
tara:strand:- start:89 stop:202 length:114 start_codon:yes stop_codon:yes gene_type:complete